MITKTFTAKFSEARTLAPSDLGANDSGWTISGEVKNDYFEWVNEFEASHPEYGRVWGDFEHEVHADSLAGYEHFYEHHPPTVWDYHDI